MKTIPASNRKRARGESGNACWKLPRGNECGLHGRLDLGRGMPGARMGRRESDGPGWEGSGGGAKRAKKGKQKKKKGKGKKEHKLV